jgi:predicted nucleotidyltransferase
MKKVMKDDRLDIDELNYKRLLTLFSKYLPGVKVMVYGSRVTGRARRYSDIDLAVFTSAGQSEKARELREALEDSDIPYRIDLWEWTNIPDNWKRDIEITGVPLA